MIEYKSAFIDTAIFIYLLEANSLYQKEAEEFILLCKKENVVLYTSSITFFEFSVLPYRNNDFTSKELFMNFCRDFDILFNNIDFEIADQASQLRAKYVNLKPMDALQIASALSVKADTFVTNDKKLRNITEINVKILI